MYQTLDDLEKNKNDIETSSKRKKRVKWILIWLWVVAWLLWLLYWMFYILVLKDMPWKCYNNPDYDPNYDCNQGITNTASSELSGDSGVVEWSNPLTEDCEFKYHTKQYCSLKPIIYIYPTSETEVNVKLWTPENLSHTYPKYNPKKWWNVIAQPNWDLEDMDTWRKLYALYREWKSDNETNFDEWFVVAWKDIIPFLEEKLAILWLNERESEEFIVYRLPQMEDNKYNLIGFETKAQQDENMPLNITPTPDTVIRVMMDWKAIDEPIDIPEQQLFTSERTGFTVVEWWGSPRN